MFQINDINGYKLIIHDIPVIKRPMSQQCHRKKYTSLISRPHTHHQHTRPAAISYKDASTQIPLGPLERLKERRKLRKLKENGNQLKRR